uniref:TBC1 domain family, member 10b n=1 Tax=Neogobius melanostomus TaxID=47308 RepID=A0A8C6TBB0_9GOBI
MAELSALPPSPPALSEPLPPAPTATLHLKMDAPTDPSPPIPKSSLYGNKGPVANALPSPSKPTPENKASGQEPPPVKERQQPGNHVRHETAGITNAQSPPSPPESAPSLYPNVNGRRFSKMDSRSNSRSRPRARPPPCPSKQAGGADDSPGPSLPLINEPAGADWTPTAPPLGRTHPAPDTLSYLESASLMSGTLESLSGLGDDGSSLGSDSEVNGLAVRRTDKYGFLGGSQYSDIGEKDMRVEVSRQREMKWLDMFNHWDKWVKHRFQKVKLRCRKGVPSSLRARAWQLLSNSHDLLQANPGKFEELEREQGEMFAARGGHGQQDLYRILKAYTVYRPDEGYCQAQAPVAAVLLMHMPAEQAFWCLVQICEKYLPGYYSAGLEFKIDPILYMTEWFMCIFSRTLPWASVLRVWDMFFCEGVKIVFRVGLVLLKQMLGSVDKLREVQGMYETMERLRNITPDLIREDVLVQEIVTLPVTEALIERECGVQVRKWRESRGELSHQPGRRLHGTRHIYEHKRRATSLASGAPSPSWAAPSRPRGPSEPPPACCRCPASAGPRQDYRNKEYRIKIKQSNNKQKHFFGAYSEVKGPISCKIDFFEF